MTDEEAQKLFPKTFAQERERRAAQPVRTEPTPAQVKAKEEEAELQRVFSASPDLFSGKTAADDGLEDAILLVQERTAKLTDEEHAALVKRVEGRQKKP